MNFMIGITFGAILAYYITDIPADMCIAWTAGGWVCLFGANKC